jgi:molecular chaperone DnaK
VSGWRLGIDFGTTNTVAAVARGEAITLVDIESNGNSRMPSAVYLTEAGDILTGSAAVHQAVFAPERFEPTPKRAIGEGEVFLGDRLVQVADMVAAILSRVFTEASRQQGETMPEQVVLTHPADWSETRLDVLREALQIGNIPAATFIPEPVAAALRIATTIKLGGVIAVYDFGGGTFDAAVLRRTDDGFVVAGPPAGRDPLGGEDIDQRIIAHIGEVLGPSAQESWSALIDPTDVAWRRHAAALRSEVQRAKETLSEVSAVQLWIPGLERDLQLTRTELDELILPEIEATVDTVDVVLKDAGVAASDLAAIYLVGGSSRIPLAADALWRRFGIRPSVQDNPKAVVSLGAVTVGSAASRRAAGVAADRTADGTAGGALSLPPSDSTFRPLVAADVRSKVWPAGCVGTIQLVVDRTGGGPSTIRVRDEATAAPNAQALAEQVGKMRTSRTPGYSETSMVDGAGVAGLEGVERRFTMQLPDGPVAMVERYTVVDGRALVLAFPEAAQPVADTISADVRTPPGGIASRFSLPMPDGWSATELLAIRRNGSRHSISIERVRHPVDIEESQWRERKADQVRAELGRALRTVGQGRVLDRLPGDITTLRWMKSGAPMLTKIGTAVHDRDAVAVTMTLSHRDQNLFGSLARHARLHPAALRRT